MLALHLHNTQRPGEKTSDLFNSFINKMDDLSSNQFQGVLLNDIPIVEDLLTLNILLYGINMVDGKKIWEIAIQSWRNYKTTVRPLTYSNHIGFMININAFFQYFRWPNCDTFFQQKFQFWAEIDYMQPTYDNCLSEKRISIPRNSI